MKEPWTTLVWKRRLKFNRRRWRLRRSLAACDLFAFASSPGNLSPGKADPGVLLHLQPFLLLPPSPPQEISVSTHVGSDP
jgi:hypothetical protein